LNYYSIIGIDNYIIIYEESTSKITAKKNNYISGRPTQISRYAHRNAHEK